MPTRKIIRIYKTRKQAEAAIAAGQKTGWTVADFQVHDMRKGWSFWKTCCLGCVFLPLALLGQKPDETEYIVTYERDEG
jgi:hypothetical protein